MKALKICLFGRPLIEWHGRQVDGFVSEKALALFAYLVLQPGSQARERLAGLFWGEMPASRARANLRMAVYNLGQLFPGCLQTSRLRVAFNRESDYWLDIEQFETTLRSETGFASSSISAMENTLPLYRGDFLEGVYLDGTPELDEWLMVERERLRQLALQGFQRYAGNLMEIGEYAKAVQAWQRLLRLEPWQESAHQGLMLALARSGEYTEALEQYEICRRLLEDELGVDPMPETIWLYERIRAARDLPFRHNLPPQPTPFIGRERELKDLGKNLANPETRLTTITGPGGVGKTRLALQAAAEQVHAFLHGVFLVPLESLSSPESLPAAIGSSLGLSFMGKTPLKTQLLGYLQDREILLVLDNFEHILEGADLVAEILLKAPLVKILATSRQRLSLQEERLFRLSGLAYPEPSVEKGWQAYAAVQLFIEAGRRIRNRFSPGEGERPAILRICQLVEGTPLVIEMAAAWIDHFSIEEIALAIETNLGSVATTVRNVPERHRSLQAVFDHSWSLLTSEEKRALSQISIFRGGFTVKAAASIVGVSAETLNALVDKSLIQVISLPDGSSRYRMHDLIRQLAYKKLLEGREEPALREKHLAFYLHYAEKAGSKLNQADQAVWVERIEQEHPNLLEALEWCMRRKKYSLSGLKLAIALAQFWEIRGYFKEGLERLEAALESCKAIPPDQLVKVLVSTGRLAFLSGEFELSQSKYLESIRLCREAQDSSGLLDSLNGLVAVLTDQGEYRQAARFGEEALERARQNGDQDKIALAANNLGLLGWYQGDYPTAHRYLEESLQIRRQMGLQLGIGYALNNLALVVLDEGESTVATRLLEESLAIRREVGDRRGTAFVLGNLGITAQYRGDFKKARDLFEESLAIRRKLEDRRYIAHTLCNLGFVAQTMGDYTGARAYYDEGQSIARRLEDPVILAFISRGLGSLLSDLVEFEEARHYLNEAVSLERRMGSGRSLGMALEKMGKMTLRAGEFSLAQTTLEESCDLFTNIHYQRGMAKAHSSLGSLDVHRRDVTKASEHFIIAFRIAARMSNPLETAVVLEGIAGLADLEDKPEPALTLLGRAAALRESSGAPLSPVDRPMVERLIESAREKLPAPEVRPIWERGLQLTNEQCLLILDSLISHQ
jgi:predicted ATPase/DNA-binding SARP family transcriptional activator/Tfp pilus assembly protein PilF